MEWEKTKPNKPKQTQLKPIKANNMPKQTQYEPKQTQFPNFPKKYFRIAFSGKIKMFIQSNLAEIAFAIITERASL